MRRLRVIAVLSALGCTSCQAGPGADHDKGAREAFAHLHDRLGRSIGYVEFTERPHGLDVELHVTELPPGPYALILHDRGACDARRGEPPFRTAGAPVRRAGGAQAGAEIEVGEEGSGVFGFRAPRLGIASGPVSLLDGDGSSALVVDARGQRRACGVVRR